MVSLADALDFFPDHRHKRGCRYTLKSLLLLIICGLMSGRKNLASIARYGQDLTREQRVALGLHPRRTPSHATLCVQLQAMDIDALQRLLGAVAMASHTDTTRRFAIDGKRLRGSRTTDGSQAGVHVLNVFCQELQASVGQLLVAEGGNEITAMLALLDQMELEDTIITGDAIFAQQEICQKIKSRGGDYIFALKDNHKLVRGAIEQTLTTVDKKTAACEDA